MASLARELLTDLVGYDVALLAVNPVGVLDLPLQTLGWVVDILQGLGGF